jgi:hypothetical protein
MRVMKMKRKIDSAIDQIDEDISENSDLDDLV